MRLEAKIRCGLTQVLTEAETAASSGTGKGTLIEVSTLYSTPAAESCGTRYVSIYRQVQPTMARDSRHPPSQ